MGKAKYSKIEVLKNGNFVLSINGQVVAGAVLSGSFTPVHSFTVRNSVIKQLLTKDNNNA